MLKDKYFDEYGLWDESQRNDNLSYNETWKHHTFNPDFLIKIFKSKVGGEPNSFLDLGAANGKYIKTMLDKKVESLGIENNKYIYNKIEDEDTKERIKFGDVVTEVDNIKDDSFDIVLESCVQYLKPGDISGYLKDVYRITNKICFILIDFKDWNEKPHEGQVTFKTKKDWYKMIKDIGFKKCYSHGKGFVCIK